MPLELVRALPVLLQVDYAGDTDGGDETFNRGEGPDRCVATSALAIDHASGRVDETCAGEMPGNRGTILHVYHAPGVDERVAEGASVTGAAPVVDIGHGVASGSEEPGFEVEPDSRLAA